MSTLIVVPARYGSSRFPGKPLAVIAGRSMLERSARVASRAANNIPACEYVVATEDKRIESHCHEKGIPVVMTPSDLATGSDRALAAANAVKSVAGAPIDRVLNLQGDAPFTPPEYLMALNQGLDEGGDVSAPFVRLDWAALDAFRKHKKITPFSGTSVIVGDDGYAIWFSKNIIPAIRNEDKLRVSESLSPVRRHAGLYGFTMPALERYSALPEAVYERLEGLEQLRMLQNGLRIKCVQVDPPRISVSGIDTPADLELAEQLIAEQGDPFS